MIVVYTLGGRAVGGHSAIAFTSTSQGPKYFSWVNTYGSQVWHDKVLIPGEEAACSTWSDIIHRIEIPTSNDGNPVNIDEDKALPRHQGIGGDKNCAETVYDLLKACGASAYDTSWGSREHFFWFPGRITWHAENIRDAAIAKIGAGNVRWPEDSDALQVFFAKDMKLRNAHSWRTTPDAAPSESDSLPVWGGANLRWNGLR